MPKTCGNCTYLVDLPPPRMSKHKTPRVLEIYNGPARCDAPQPIFPMVQADHSVSRRSAWADTDATNCALWTQK